MPTNQILILVVMGAAFYFLLLRPQQQQAKRQAEMIASLTPGKRIVTIGGIYATIVDVDDDRLRIEVADGTQLEIIKRAVGSVLPDDDVDVEDDEADSEELDAEDEAPAMGDGSADGGNVSSEGTPADA